MPNRNREKRYRYWDAGAASLQSLGGPYEYICPVCLYTFDREPIEQFRLGHTLPKSLRGKLEVLVCAGCEDGSGHELDAHACRIDLYHRISRGNVFPATSASLTFEGIEADVQLQRRPGVDYNDILGQEHRNPPGVLEQQQAAFQRHVEAGTTPLELHFRLHLPPTSERRAKVSYLRAAYLTAFAAFGYWAIARPGYDRVRRQIAEPDAEHIAQFFHRFDDQHGYNVGVLGEPSWQASIVVLMGDYQITLPLENDDGIYERLAEKAAAGASWTARGRWFGWPRRPEYRWDRAVAQQISASNVVPTLTRQR